MLFLALPTLRARWVSFLGVLTTAAAAVMLMTATGALLEAGVHRHRSTGAPRRCRDRRRR